MTAHTFRHWQLNRDFQGIAWLTLDRQGESVNSLSAEVLEEFRALLEELQADLPAGLVIQSGKDTGFIAGADIREFEQQDDVATAQAAIKTVHQLFARLEALPCPTVAAIDGFCLGGGLELALACDYRVATAGDKTRIGFPEVRLGIFPGFGGCARSIRLLGGRRAVELMLGSRQLSASRAKTLGLVDQVAPPHSSLRWSALNIIERKPKRRTPSPLEWCSSAPLIRNLLAGIMERTAGRKVRPEHYPAPYALIKLWQQAGGNFQALLDGEVREVSELLMSDTSKNLRRVFRLRQMLSELGKGDAFAGGVKPRRVHVVGAGVMGGDIAAWCALRGLEVTLQDRGISYVEPALKRAESLFRKRLKNPARVSAAKGRLLADVQGKGIGRADVIIEAIFENLEAKQELFAGIEQQASPAAVLATNTSAIPLEQIAAKLQQPERLIGLHFFNPVAQMPLVEVVRGGQSADADIRRGCQFAGQIGKYPLPVKSAPGFLVNRVLGPYMLRALDLAEAGYTVEQLDLAAEQFGMPMGPVELADTVGLDVAASVVRQLSPGSANAINRIQQMIAYGMLGRKSGQGFYNWEKGKPVKTKLKGNPDLNELGIRLVQPLLDACRQCLEDGIVENRDLLDGGVIFGTGFAPFRGGPLHYLDSLNPAPASG